MKKIDTLVEDIYSLFSPDPVDMTEEKIDEHINNFGEMIKVHIKEFLCGEPREVGNLRLSAIGKPDRQLWYDFNKQQTSIPIKSSTKIKFLYGYILEELLLLCSSIAGHKVTDQQKEVELEGVKGHQDSLIDGVLVDCKSASGPGFQKFKNNSLSYDDPFGYIAQISAYAEANGLDEAAFLAIDKSTGEICLSKVHSMEMINAKDRVKYLKNLVKQSLTPSRCYEAVPDGKSGNHKLAVGCVYCSHKKDCWADLNSGNGLRVFQYARGKRFLTTVAKEPEVPEVFDW
jgi:hypothetical protein|tara:strand:- start:3248 stop:4108 length:861 start_codon:yes stop_codon:yes gene_type:complete